MRAANSCDPDRRDRYLLIAGLQNVLEFLVESNHYPAECGTGAGGKVTLVGKSGSNELHRSLFEFIRNDKLAAGNIFDDAD